MTFYFYFMTKKWTPKKKEESDTHSNEGRLLEKDRLQEYDS